MNKVFVLPPNENWIVDQMVNDWYTYNQDISTKNIIDADVVWLLADWAWNRIPASILTAKKVITTVHHIVPEKFNLAEFQYRDKFTDVYHVFNQKTYDQICQLTTKSIVKIPYWANQNIWKIVDNRDVLREKHNIPNDAYVIGSFQRDTEGSDLESPKLEKGPDLFFNAVEKIYKIRDKTLVLLAGWRRQYLIKKFKSAQIPFLYIELPSQPTLNELYQTLDVYLVTARYEGGPQSLLECGLTGTRVCSRDVGIASDVLPENAIHDDVTLATPAVPNIKNYMIPFGFADYRKLITEL